MEQAVKNMETKSAVNGVNVDELFGTIDAVKKAPVIAKFKFRAENQWIDDGHNRTTLKNFYGTQQDHEHRCVDAAAEHGAHLVATDPLQLHEGILQGEDPGPDPAPARGAQVRLVGPAQGGEGPEG